MPFIFGLKIGFVNYMKKFLFYAQAEMHQIFMT